MENIKKSTVFNFLFKIELQQFVYGKVKLV